MAWRLVKLGGPRVKVQVKPQRCGHGSVQHGNQCEMMRRDAPGATRCYEHRYEETMGCSAHDNPSCKACPPRPSLLK